MRLLAVVIGLLLLGATSLPPLGAQGLPRIVAVGDIQGNVDRLTAILTAAGVIDANHRWAGGRTQLVQTGDYLDHGEDIRAVLDLLMALERQAKDAGGRATALLGKHEVLNLLGDTQYVSRATYASFTDAGSAATRQRAWEDYAALAARHQQTGAPLAPVYAQTREAWLTTHPLGYAEYHEALSRRGKYGAWLRDKPMVTQLAGNIFMHAGVNPEFVPEALDDLNRQLRKEIQRMDLFREQLIWRKLATREFSLQEILQVASNEMTKANLIISTAQAAGKRPGSRSLNVPLLVEIEQILKIDAWLALNPNGALWYSGLAMVRDDPEGGPFTELLQKYGARRFITSRSLQQGRSITVRFGGRVAVINARMASLYTGRFAALEIQGDRLTAIYDDGRVAVSAP